MTTTLTKPVRWTKKLMQEEVDKLDAEIEIYWDYRDELGSDAIAKIVNKGEEGLDEVIQELTDHNCDYHFQQKNDAIETALESMRKVAPVSEAAEQRFKDLVDESDKLLMDVNIKDLARRSRAYFVVIVNDTETCYQAYRGVESKGQVDELCKIFDLLNLNPSRFQKWVTADNEARPSYDPEPVIFPDKPERDGHEFVTVEDMDSVMNETPYGGQFLFMVELCVGDIIKDAEGYTKGPLRVHKGTWGFPYCFMNGAGPCAEVKLTQDLVLPAGSYTLRLDADLRHGVQSCYGFTAEPWRAGNVTPEKPLAPTPETTSNSGSTD